MAALLAMFALFPSLSFAIDNPDAQIVVETQANSDVIAPDAHAAVKEGHAKEGGLPQLDFATYAPQLFWMTIIFGILYLVMSQKALPEIGGIIENRKNLIDSNLKSAEDIRAQSKSIQESYEKTLDGARSDAAKILQDVETTSKSNVAQMMESFRRKTDDEIKSAEIRTDIVKTKAMGDMAGIAAEVAGEAAMKITGISTDMQKAKAIVDAIAGKAKAA